MLNRHSSCTEHISRYCLFICLRICVDAAWICWNAHTSTSHKKKFLVSVNPPIWRRENYLFLAYQANSLLRRFNYFTILIRGVHGTKIKIIITYPSSICLSRPLMLYCSLRLHWPYFISHKILNSYSSFEVLEICLLDTLPWILDCTRQLLFLYLEYV